MLEYNDITHIDTNNLIQTPTQAFEQEIYTNISTSTHITGDYLTNNIISATHFSIPKLENIIRHEYPDAIRKKIEDKRKLQRIWQSSGHPKDKRKLKNATKKLKILQQKFTNESVQNIWKT